MHVLYINHPDFDHQHSTLIEGLAQVSGIHLTAASVAANGHLAAVSLDYSAEAVIHAASTSDVVIFGTYGKYSQFPALTRQVIAAGKPDHQRWVLVDSGDLCSLPDPPCPWHLFDAVVKRELLVESASLGTLISCLVGRRVRNSVENRFRRHPLVPFPNVQGTLLARPSVTFPSGRRTRRLRSRVPVRCEPIGAERLKFLDPHPSPRAAVTCTLTPNVDARRRILNHLSADPRVVVHEVHGGTLPVHGVPFRRPPALENPYLQWLHSHRASISFPGGGLDTARFWEILAVGSLLISKRNMLDLPVEIVDGRHYVGFDTMGELDEAISFAVSDSTEVNQIRLRGHGLAAAAYSSTAIALRIAQRELGCRTEQD